MKALTIGQVAQGAGIGVETVRFCERRGLLAAPERTASGYRQYGREAISRLQFIRRAKDLGFTLNWRSPEPVWPLSGTNGNLATLLPRPMCAGTDRRRSSSMGAT